MRQRQKQLQRKSYVTCDSGNIACDSRYIFRFNFRSIKILIQHFECGAIFRTKDTFWVQIENSLRLYYIVQMFWQRFDKQTLFDIACLF